MSQDSTLKPTGSQPEAIAPMKVSRKAGGNRNALNREIGADGLRDWSFGLFDCFSTSSLCFWATFCPCVVYGQTKQRLRHLRRHGVPLPGGGERFNDHCRIYCCVAVPCFCWVLEMGSRSDIRNRYEIRGDSVRDCLVSLCCRPCGLTQERREIELEEKNLS